MTTHQAGDVLELEDEAVGEAVRGACTSGEREREREIERERETDRQTDRQRGRERERERGREGVLKKMPNNTNIVVQARRNCRTHQESRSFTSLFMEICLFEENRPGPQPRTRAASTTRP